MEKIPQHLDDILLRYIDGALTKIEKQDLDDELKQNDALKNRLHQLQTLHLALRNGKPEQPSKNFTQLVMGKLDQYPKHTRSFSVRNGILLLAGVLVAVGIASVLVSSGAFDSATTTIDLNQVQFPKKYMERTLPSIPFNGKLIVNIIILLNLGLAWLVLDRAILKPFFQRRMEAGH